MREIRIWMSIGVNVFMNSDTYLEAIQKPSLRAKISNDSEKSQRSNPLIRSARTWITQPLKHSSTDCRVHISAIALMFTRNDGYSCTELRINGLPRYAPSLSLRCFTRNDGYSSMALRPNTLLRDGNRFSHHFNSEFSHANNAIHHIIGYVSKTSYNFESI